MSAVDRPGRRGTLVGGLWNLASNLLPMVGTAALSIVMGRLLGATELGVQSLIAYVESLVSALIVWALTAASIQTLASRFGAGDEAGFASLARWSYWGHALGGALSSIVLIVVGLFSDDPLPWFIVSVSALLNAFGWAFAVRIIGREGWGPVASRRLIWQSVAQLLGIGAVLVGFGIVGVFVANVVAAAGLLVMLVRMTPPLHKPSFAPFPTVLVRLFGTFFVLSLLSQLVNRRIEFLFLGAYSTAQQVAMYSVGFMLVSTAAIIPASITGAGTPAVATAHGARDLDAVAAQLGTAVRVIMAASLPLTAGLVALGPTLIRLLYGPEFDEAAQLVPLLSLTIVVVPAAGLLAAYWSGVGVLRLLLISEAIGGVIDLLAAWILVPRYGAWGAAWANVAGQGTASVLLLVFTWWVSGRFGLGPARWAFGVVVSVLATAVGYALTQWLPGWVGFVAGSVGLLAVVLLAGRTVGLVSAPDARWLAETVPQRLGWTVRLVGRPA